MKRISAEEVPEFNGIVDFADWWNFNGGFLLPPEPLEVFDIGVASTAVIFRHGRFQVEQYLLFPGSGAGEHRHPYLDSVVNAAGQLFNTHITADNVDWGTSPHGKVLQQHDIPKNGMFFYIAQHWTEPSMSMATVLCSWADAEPLSDKHKDLLSRYNKLGNTL